MKATTIDILATKICGKRILSVEPSQWSGEVKSLTKNQDFISISLEDGTVLEVGQVFIREGRP